MHLSKITIRSLGIFSVLLTTFPLWAASPQQIRWQELSFVTGKTVSLVMPGGTLISGKAGGVDADTLTVNVTKTTNPGAYPRGEVRVPRASLRIVEVQTKGRKFRIIGTAIGAVAGFAGGIGAAIEIMGGIFGNEHPGAAGLALTGITAGGTVAGYMVGNRADRRSTTYEILP